MDAVRQGGGASRGAVVVAVLVALLGAGLLVRWLVPGPGQDPRVAGTATSAPVASRSATPSATHTASPTSTPGADGTSPAADAPDGDPAEVQTLGLALDEEAEAWPGVSARLAAIESVRGVAQGAGEVGGPSLRIAVEVENDSAAPAPTRDAVVNLYYGPDRTPATLLGAPGAEPLPRSLEPGESATGRFVFNVPVDERDDVHVELVLGPGASILLFSGAA